MYVYGPWLPSFQTIKIFFKRKKRNKQQYFETYHQWWYETLYRQSISAYWILCYIIAMFTIPWRLVDTGIHFQISLNKWWIYPSSNKYWIQSTRLCTRVRNWNNRTGLNYSKPCSIQKIALKFTITECFCLLSVEYINQNAQSPRHSSESLWSCCWLEKHFFNRLYSSDKRLIQS